MSRAGSWERAVLHSHVPEHPTPQAAGTEYFSLDVEDVPAAGSRSDRLFEVRPQVQVLQHTVEHEDGISRSTRRRWTGLRTWSSWVPLSALLTGRLGVAGSIAPPLRQVLRGSKRRGGRGKPGVVEFLDKLVVVPVVVQRHFLGSARGVQVPQTTDAVEEIPLVRVFVEQIVVCQYHRSWRLSSCRRSRRKSWR